MPRPGPRPFECVRRSWHSDRHQPIRGSIIQQIFRVAHENHSPGTKKNREWQEKLPLVVLKSEEIMYSKANSEAEYLDPETLWDRLNDAINTIIRKDESMETGEFLPPCVEAALNLGCVPVRSSRSQRNSNTRSYLGPRNQDSNIALPSNTRNMNLNVENPNVNKDPHPGSSFYRPVFENFPKQVPFVARPSTTVYPLYHGFHFQPRVPERVFPSFHNTHQNPNNIIIGTPVFQATRESLPVSSHTGCSERPLKECDLSLRLGLVSNKEKGLTSVNDVDLDSRKEFAFFPLSSDTEEVNRSVMDGRKRKMECFLDSGHGFDQINEQIKRRGL